MKDLLKLISVFIVVLLLAAGHAQQDLQTITVTQSVVVSTSR